MADKIEFSTFQLLVDDQFPQKQNFSSLPTSIEYRDDFLYLGASVLTDQYLWLDFNYGKSFPRASDIVDEETLKKTPNPRGVSQIEPNNQLFALLSFDTGILFLSSRKKKSFLETFLSTNIQKDISIKSIFKNIDEFYEQISSIHLISFTSVKRNLFSKSGTIQTMLQDNYGMEEPEEFSVEAKYRISINQRIKNAIGFLIQEKTDNHLKKLIIQGRDDQGFSKIFNEGAFINKIEIYPSKNANGLFTAIQVKDLLLDKIYE